VLNCGTASSATGCRFLDALTNKRRETQEKLAEKAIDEARRRQEQDAVKAAEQNGSAVSAPVTPATTPTAPLPSAIREGVDQSYGCKKVTESHSP